MTTRRQRWPSYTPPRRTVTPTEADNAAQLYRLTWQIANGNQREFYVLAFDDEHAEELGHQQMEIEFDADAWKKYGPQCIKVQRAQGPMLKKLLLEQEDPGVHAARQAEYARRQRHSEVPR